MFNLCWCRIMVDHGDKNISSFKPGSSTNINLTAVLHTGTKSYTKNTVNCKAKIRTCQETWSLAENIHRALMYRILCKLQNICGCYIHQKTVLDYHHPEITQTQNQTMHEQISVHAIFNDKLNFHTNPLCKCHHHKVSLWHPHWQVPI